MHLRRSNLSTARMSLVRALVLLFTIVIDGSESQYGGISLVDFCNCWNAEVTRIINKLYVDISFNKTCWQSPSQTEDYSFLINYDSAMSFKIRITESRMVMSHLTQLDCKLSEGCSTTFKMVRNTTIEIAPDCSPCGSCRGRNTGDIPYINEHTTQLIEKVHVKKKAPPIRTIQPIESTHSVLVVIAAAVLTIVVILVFTIIITIACRKFRTRTDQGEIARPILTPSDASTGSSPMSELDSQDDTDFNVIGNDIPAHSPVQIGVFYPRMPFELSSTLTENNLDKHVKHMVELLGSMKDLIDVKQLTPNASFSNCYDNIEDIANSPRVLIVLCDRLCELIHELKGQDVNRANDWWRKIELYALKKIRDNYYRNITLYFVSFKNVKHQCSVFFEVRALFTSQSYKVYSVETLDERDGHFKELLDSILLDVIHNKDERTRRINMLLNSCRT